MGRLQGSEGLRGRRLRSDSEMEKGRRRPWWRPEQEVRSIITVQGVLKVLSVAAECTLPPFVLLFTLRGVLAIL